MKFYVKQRIPGKRPVYYPSIMGFVFDDMPFGTATEANNMGRDLLKSAIEDVDRIADWEEKYVPTEEELELAKTPFHKRVVGDAGK